MCSPSNETVLTRATGGGVFAERQSYAYKGYTRCIRQVTIKAIPTRATRGVFAKWQLKLFLQRLHEVYSPRDKAVLTTATGGGVFAKWQLKLFLQGLHEVYSPRDKAVLTRATWRGYSPRDMQTCTGLLPWTTTLLWIQRCHLEGLSETKDTSRKCLTYPAHWIGIVLFGIGDRSSEYRGRRNKGPSLVTLRASLSGTFLQTLPDLVTPLKGYSLSPRSCPPTRSAPSERFRYW